MGSSGLTRWLGWAVAAAMATAIGVGTANVATHYSRAWFGTDPDTEFFLGLAGFLVGALTPLVVLFVVRARASRA